MMANQNSHSYDTNSSTLVSVVVPCYNESEVIQIFYETVTKILDDLNLTDQKLEYELVLVDDGSSDSTLLLVNDLANQDSRVKVCSLSRNFGHQIALTAGLDHAQGDAVILMDADLQHPPSVIPEFISQWQAGFDIVSGVRENSQGDSWLKNVTSNSFYKLFNILSATKIPEGAGDFCLLSKRVCDALRNMPERHRFLRGMVSWTGFSRKLVAYECADRAAGVSKYTVAKMIALAMDAVFSFSAQPLRLALRLGLTMATLGFIYLFWSVMAGIIGGNLVPGYASLIGVTVTLGGCQLAFIGMIGEYLGRVFEEVKGRPIYSLRQGPIKPPQATSLRAPQEQPNNLINEPDRQ